MIQPLFNGMLAILLAKFVLNDVPHMLEQISSPTYSAEFLNFMISKVATAEYSSFPGASMSRALDSIKISKPDLARLLNIYYRTATERATPEEVDIAFRIASTENSRLAYKYKQYGQLHPTGEDFTGIASAIEITSADIKAASTQSDKVIAVDRFVSLTHEMIVDRWEGYELSGIAYPLPFDLTDEEASLYREYLDVLSK